MRKQKKTLVKSDFQKGLEHLMNTPNLNPFTNPSTFEQMRNASALPLASLMTYIGTGKKNTKRQDYDRSKERIEKMEQD
jgi:hypothetical protein